MFPPIPLHLRAPSGCLLLAACQVLHLHYDELSSFLVRHTEAELERQAQAVSRRRLMDWEQVRRPPHSPALVRHGGGGDWVTGSLDSVQGALVCPRADAIRWAVRGGLWLSGASKAWQVPTVQTSAEALCSTD
jgi:hypothetical protein